MGLTEIASPRVRQALEDAADPNGFLPMDQFVEIALYDPDFGYYRSARERVGKRRSSDFYTASNLKEAFVPILIEATEAMLSLAGFKPSEVAFVEIGSEPGAALLEESPHPFADARSIRVGQEIELEGPCVAFSNELFDAQPFHSVRFEDGSWRELGVDVASKGITLGTREAIAPELASIVPQLPAIAPEGYTVDLALRATALLEKICEQPWTGAFIAFDYGKTWQALSYDTPQGTARAYRNHTQAVNLLDAVGEQDLTCHICWDWLEGVLQQRGFESIVLESQEAFALKRAPNFVEKAISSESGFASLAKGQLRQLIHPSLMGQKFQALSGIRC